jgi:iron(III) transport system substrate-binding protein
VTAISLLWGCGAAATPSRSTPPATSASAPAQATPTEWDQAVAAARREGTVVVAGPPGELYRQALLAFSEQFPGITVEYTSQSGRDLAPRIGAERAAGKYLWDVFIGGAGDGIFSLKPQVALDPLKAALLLPEVLDDGNWLGGFADGWMERDELVYGFQGDLSQHVLVNRAAVPESELSAVEQLLEPKWAGKVSLNDPRTPSAGSGIAGYWYLVKGEEWLRDLFRTDLTVTRDLRQQIEWLVRERYPIAIGGDVTMLQAFQSDGLGSQVKTLAPESQLGSRLTPGSGNLMVFNHAPHPNAAKVYINWLLSQAGQRRWVEITQRNSRRLDVPGPPETAPQRSSSYILFNKEEHQPYISRGMEIAQATLP